MKRVCCFLIAVSFILSGCQLFEERLKDPVTFYYVWSDYQEELQDVIAPEQREASGHRDDLSYLMALYLMGPAEEDHISPIPRGTRIYVMQNNASGVELKLSDTSRTMTDTEFSLACSCLALTCMELTGTEKVTINSENRSVTMTPETLLLNDSSISAAGKENP